MELVIYTRNHKVNWEVMGQQQGDPRERESVALKVGDPRWGTEVGRLTYFCFAYQG